MAGCRVLCADGGGGGGSADDQLRELVEAEVVDNSPDITWADIAGLQSVKDLLQVNQNA